MVLKQETQPVYKKLNLGDSVDELAVRYREILNDLHLIGQIFAKRLVYYTKRLFRSREDLLLYLGILTSVNSSPRFPYRNICEENQAYFNYYFIMRGGVIFEVFKQLQKKDQKRLQQALLDQSIELYEVDKESEFEEKLRLADKYKNYPENHWDFLPC